MLLFLYFPDVDPTHQGGHVTKHRSFQPIHLPIGGGVYWVHLTHKKQRIPRTLQQDYAQCPVVPLEGGGVSYERGTPVGEGDKNLGV